MAVDVAGEVTVACIQMEPMIGRKADNIRRMVELIEAAARAGARLVVLPELCTTGYAFESVAEVESVAEEVTGATVAAWAAVAARERVYVVAGHCERAAGVRYNSAVLVGPGGLVGVYRKTHLWNRENLFFSPGNLGFPVFETTAGRVGMSICYDGWFPEAYRSCALQGADIVCMPTNWVPVPGHDPAAEPMALTLARAAAHCNGIYVAAADRVGTERGETFLGRSAIVSDTGAMVAGPASPDQEETLFAALDIVGVRARRQWNDWNRVLGDRRPEHYVGAGVSPADRTSTLE